MMSDRQLFWLAFTSFAVNLFASLLNLLILVDGSSIPVLTTLAFLACGVCAGYWGRRTWKYRS